MLTEIEGRLPDKAITWETHKHFSKGLRTRMKGVHEFYGIIIETNDNFSRYL